MRSYAVPAGETSIKPTKSGLLNVKPFSCSETFWLVPFSWVVPPLVGTPPPCGPTNTSEGYGFAPKGADPVEPDAGIVTPALLQYCGALSMVWAYTVWVTVPELGLKLPPPE